MNLRIIKAVCNQQTHDHKCIKSGKSTVFFLGEYDFGELFFMLQSADDHELDLGCVEPWYLYVYYSVPCKFIIAFNLLMKILQEKREILD